MADISNITIKGENGSENNYNIKDIIARNQLNKTIYYYDNVENMKNDNTLQNGFLAKTLGFFAKNDEGESYYLIRNKIASDVINNYSLIEISNTNLVAELLVDSVLNLRQFGVFANGVNDDSQLINNAVLFLAKKGGGILKGIKNATSIISNPILLVSNIRYEFFNYTIQGSTLTINLFESGYYDNETDSIKSNISEHGTGTTGNGTHYVENMILEGCTLKNAGTGVRGHRLNYNTCIQNCNFDYTLQNYSVNICHSWSFVFRMNYVRQLAYFYNFADWTLIENNSFEGRENTYTTGLQIGNGSYSCKIMSNGFHALTRAGIEIINECRDTEISNCHFEGNGVGILNNDTSGIISNISVHNNWFLAGTAGTNSSAINMKTCISSEFKQNTFSGNWQFFYNLNGGVQYGNTIYLSNSSYYTNLPENLNIGRGTIVKLIASNNSGTMLPQIENITNGNYTAEKFLSKHIFADNNIAMCTATKTSDNTIVIDTFINCNDISLTGYESVFYNILAYPTGKSRTYQLTGIIINNKVNELFNNTLSGTYDTMTVTPSNNNGKLRLTITNAVHNLAIVQGYIKII